MNVDEALLLADDAHTGFSGHLEALRVLAAEVRRQHAEIEDYQETIIQTIAHIEVARAIMKEPE
jgi:hypothetical protein